MPETTILILGGGFGGVSAALELSKQALPNTKIRLVSNKPHFEYHATLYRVLTGKSPLQVCIPLAEIFEGTDVEILEETIDAVDLANRSVHAQSGTSYSYDYLVMAFGSEVAYYNTEGLREYSFTIDSIDNVLRLKNHLHQLFVECQLHSEKENVCNANVVIVGGGVTGCEVAGELAEYLPYLAKTHGIDQSVVTIELIHAGTRLVPNLPEDVSAKILRRLHSLGVNVFLNRPVTKEEVASVYMSDMMMKTKTLIWTAGVKTNSIYSAIKGLEFDERGKVLVSGAMIAKGFSNVFVIGDAASTKFTGMAQTALHDGAYVASYLSEKLHGKTQPIYNAIKPNYAVPVGKRWAAAVWNGRTYYGFIGWLLRKWSDYTFFRTVLPFSKAMTAFSSEGQLWESCPICSKAHIADNTL